MQITWWVHNQVRYKCSDLEEQLILHGGAVNEVLTQYTNNAISR